MAVRISLLFSATPEQLFDAWTKKELVKHGFSKINKHHPRRYRPNTRREVGYL